MKKYLVVKHNLMRNQKFYRRTKTLDSWTVDKEQAHKFATKRTAEKIAQRYTAGMNDCWKDIIRYEVEEVM